MLPAIITPPAGSLFCVNGAQNEDIKKNDLKVVELSRCQTIGTA